MRREDYDVFQDRFSPLFDDRGESCFVSFNDQRLEWVGEEFIWTLVDCDGKSYIIPGRHYVNRMEYIICRNPWKEGQRDYFYC